ncbi:olfactory receptor 1052-like [Rhinatrema bivittatum]|uniref:olfactory receptor 1052-like n=2 Tax=Rhinatrema bivittatum TaxID=194408 RepID=UPI001127C632|nr:olfactory receptor 1052-like [Rhinatrema bivittatum]
MGSIDPSERMPEKQQYWAPKRKREQGQHQFQRCRMKEKATMANEDQGPQLLSVFSYCYSFSYLTLPPLRLPNFRGQKEKTQQLIHKQQAQSKRDMQTENQTQVTEFLIQGFSDHPNLQALIFIVFLFIYLVTLTGNLTILILMCIDLRLHKPMYFFLTNLAILDICFTSMTLPKLLAISLTESKTISFKACMAQLYLVMVCASGEFYLLCAMAYDRYVAICNPLRYSVVMNKRVCILLSASSWLAAFLDSLPHSVSISYSSFCGHNVINHFFCDFQTLLKLSCSDTSMIKLLMVTLNLSLVLGLLIFILTSYIYIISTILKIQSVEGRHKAFSTCSSHLTVIVIYSGTVLFVYMRPFTMDTRPEDKLFGVLFNVIIPMLNPIIYSLRNKDVKDALRKAMSGRLRD